jgi:predicted amino acid-binding ACT domain protein
MGDYDRSIHNNPDAQAWAKFFIDTLAEQSWHIEDIDEALMIGWFANAMMAMHDHTKRKWVELTDDEIDQGLLRSNYAVKTAEAWRDGVEWATKQLKEKNK